MLNEKKLMADKLMIFSFVAGMAGSLIGIGMVLAFMGIKGSPTAGIVGFIMIISSVVCGIIADRIKNELRDFINRPYLEEIEEKE